MFAVDILPTQIYGFECESIDEIVAALKDEPHLPHKNGRTVQSENSFLHKKHPALGEYLQQCNDEVWDHIKDERSDARLVTTQCWMSRADPGEQHLGHRHPNSVVSGIMYLTTSKAPTLFQRKNQYRLGYIMTTAYQNTLDYYQVECVAGHVVMFPSKLQHLVPVNDEDETRMTLSWNTFLDGSIATAESLSQLTVKVA